MMTLTTRRIVGRFGCMNCQYFRVAKDGRGHKTTCGYGKGKAIRYIKRCPKVR